MSLEVPDDEDDGVEAAVKEERRRRRWKKVNMSPEMEESIQCVPLIRSVFSSDLICFLKAARL